MLVEGALCEGGELVILDDLVTKFSSTFEVLWQIKQVAKSKNLSDIEYSAITDYLENKKKYRQKEIQEKIIRLAQLR